MLTNNHNKRQYNPAIQIDTLDYYSLFPIARLHHLDLSTAFRTYHNHYRRDLAYYKPNLIKVLNIIFINFILSYHILYKVKLTLNYYWIFILSFLVVVFIYKIYL